MKTILLLTTMFLISCGKDSPKPQESTTRINPEQSGQPKNQDNIPMIKEPDEPDEPATPAQPEKVPVEKVVEQAKTLAKQTWAGLKDSVKDKERPARIELLNVIMNTLKSEAVVVGAGGVPQIIDTSKSILGEDMTKKYIEPLANDEESIPMLAAFLADLAHVNNATDELSDGKTSFSDITRKGKIALSLPSDLTNLKASTLAVQERANKLKGSSGNMYQDLKKSFFDKLPKLPKSVSSLLPESVKGLFKS